MAKKKKAAAKKALPIPTVQTDYWERNGNFYLGFIILVALALRIIALAGMNGSLYGDFLLWDERIYHQWAQKIADGSYASKSVYEFSPLTAYIMAALYRVLGPDIFYVKIFNLILGVLTCLLIYLTGREIGDRKVGLLAAAIACCCQELIFYSIVPLKTAQSVFLFSAMIYLTVSSLNTPTIVKGALLGIATGLLVNVRPNCAFLILLLPLFYLWQAFRGRIARKTVVTAFLLFALGTAMSLAPFMIRNYRVAGVWAVTTSQSGFNLYLANNPQEKGPYFLPVSFATTSPYEQGVQFTIEASRKLGKRLTSWEASTYWRNEILRLAGENPAAFLWKFVQKTVVFFQNFQPANMYYIDFLKNYIPFFKIPLPNFFLIMPLGMVGLIFSLRRSPTAVAAALIFALYALSLILFFTTTRYRLPLFAILIPWAALGLCQGRAIIRRRNYATMAIFAAPLAFFLAIQLFPLPGKGDLTAYINTHAINLSEKRSLKEAVANWEISSALNGRYSVFADLSLAKIYFQLGQGDKGKLHLDKIPADSFAAAQKFEVMGDQFARQQKWTEAAQLYQQALAVNYGLRTVWMKLIRTNQIIDPQQAKQQETTFRYISSFYDVF